MRDEPKRAVAVICTNKNLYDFLWYYCTYNQDYKWTAIVQYYGTLENQKLFDVCKKLGIFENVLRCEDNYELMPFYQKCYEMLKMICYYILKKRKQYFVKIIKKYVENFNLAVVCCDHMLIHAAFISMGDEKEIIILEDGLGDYQKRYNYLYGKISDIYNLAAFLCAKMGYFNFKMCYALPTTKTCIKYSKDPEKLVYRDYKFIRKLQDFSNTDEVLFYRLLKIWLGKLPGKLSAEAIFFTSTLYDYIEDDDIQTQKSIEYINKHFEGKTIFLKKHPRDRLSYKFSNSVNVIELSSYIPAEILVDILDINVAIFMDISNIILLKEEYQKEGYFLRFKNYKQKIGQKDYDKTFGRLMHQFEINDKQIIEIY